MRHARFALVRAASTAVDGHTICKSQPLWLRGLRAAWLRCCHAGRLHWLASCCGQIRPHAMESDNMTRTDAEIKQLVSDELKWDTRVKDTDVGVEVDNGVVTLTGTVSSYGERQAAQRAAHRVAGVLDVANDIQVKVPGSPGHTDTELAQFVRHALEWDVFVPEQRIATTVSDGWVTLEGEVVNWNQRDAAERAIRNLAGLVGVVNNLVVSSSAFAGDIRSAIESALNRHAAREASHLNVEVHGGRVTLRGSVGSFAEKKAVLGAARGTKGVKNIIDQLRIG